MKSTKPKLMIMSNMLLISKKKRKSQFSLILGLMVWQCPPLTK